MYDTVDRGGQHDQRKRRHPVQASARAPQAHGLPRSLVAHPRYGPRFALAGFLIGATAGGAMIIRVGSDRAALPRAGTAAEAALAAVALVLAALSGDPGVTHGTSHAVTGAFGPAITDALAAVLATAMGIQNAVAAAARPAPWRTPAPQPN